MSHPPIIDPPVFVHEPELPAVMHGHWRRWFAWYPVRTLLESKRVWLRFVERRPVFYPREPRLTTEYRRTV